MKSPPASRPAGKPFPVIVALDLPSASAAERLVERIDGATDFFKIGLELFAAGEGMQLVERLAGRGLAVFADFKFFDIPATVGRATARIAEAGATFVSVHGQDAMLEQAVAAAGTTGVLAVTALTSLAPRDMQELGFSCDVRGLATSRARRSVELGCAGAVCSPLEAAAVRAAVGPAAAVVTPGIRAEPAGGDDQIRTASIKDAITAGASHVVVGRPVRDAADPAQAVRNLVEQAEQARREISGRA
ncbi:MAG: orotidine-5'-phosphate decarboxylase [Betaproteobacteria bacterium]|nr:orotidine-5'-phosphate decarboxylase [Betaproteobacteria bacterium]